MLISVYRLFIQGQVVSIFLETVDGVECIQALKIAKLIRIKNVTQFVRCNDIDAVKSGVGRQHPWFVTVQGAIQMMIKRDFGGDVLAANMFRRLGRLNDTDRVCTILELLEELNPGILDLKPRGRRVKKEAA